PDPDEVQAALDALTESGIGTSGDAPVRALAALARAGEVRFEVVGDIPVRVRHRDGVIRPPLAAVWAARHNDIIAFEFDLDGHRVEWLIDSMERAEPVDPVSAESPSESPSTE